MRSKTQSFKPVALLALCTVAAGRAGAGSPRHRWIVLLLLATGLFTAWAGPLAAAATSVGPIKGGDDYNTTSLVPAPPTSIGAGVCYLCCPVLQIPLAGNTTGDTFSVFSASYPEDGQEDPASKPLPDSPYDVPALPGGLFPVSATGAVNYASVQENGTYVSPGGNGNSGSFTFNSDHDVVPEPASIALIAAATGTLLLCRCHRLAPRPLR